MANAVRYSDEPLTPEATSEMVEIRVAFYVAALRPNRTFTAGPAA